MAISLKYPGGLAALAILVMRFALSLNLLHSIHSITSFTGGACLMVAASLVVGLFSRTMAFIALQLVLAVGRQPGWMDAIISGQAGMALALLLLGGGRLSLDAGLFGRRVIRVRG
jgi:hypothetical protein